MSEPRAGDKSFSCVQEFSIEELFKIARKGYVKLEDVVKILKNADCINLSIEEIKALRGDE